MRALVAEVALVSLARTALVSAGIGGSQNASLGDSRRPLTRAAAAAFLSSICPPLAGSEQKRRNRLPYPLSLSLLLSLWADLKPLVVAVAAPSCFLYLCVLGGAWRPQWRWIPGRWSPDFSPSPCSPCSATWSRGTTSIPSRWSMHVSLFFLWCIYDV